MALAEASGGDAVLQNANAILTDAVDTGAIDDPYAREAIRSLVRSSRLEVVHRRFKSSRSDQKSPA